LLADDFNRLVSRARIVGVSCLDQPWAVQS
jgi:hypothetical protein